jgi:hypothetical protein
LASFDDVLGHLRRQLGLAWQADAPPEARVWILWYDKSLDRRVRGRLHELEQATRAAGRGWRHLGLAPLFPAWVSRHEFFPRLTRRPDQLRGMLPELRAAVGARVRDELAACGPGDLLALSGCGSMFGVLRASELIEDAAPHVRGRLLLLFPGHHRGGVYRLLDASDGWNYRAIPIPASDAP